MTPPVTPLRQRLTEDMQLRNFSPHTIEAYVRAVAYFAKRFGRSPDQLTGEQVRQHLLWLVKERRVSWSLYNTSRCALQFFFRVTLGRDEWFDQSSRRCATVGWCSLSLWVQPAIAG
jgi:hypothetical protein